VSLTDPDSRAMAAHTKVGVGYNAQMAVDAKYKMIVEQAVSNDVLDMGLLQQTAEPARQILDVEKIDVVADKGYFRTEDIVACEKAGLMPHVPKPQRGPAVASGFFRKDEFRYDAAQDVCICPGGHELKPIRKGQLRDMRKVDYANANACRDCPLRSRCTNTYRAVSRLEYEDALERMEERIAERPEILDRRREIVEHPFGRIKQWMNQGAFLTRGLDKVRAEFSARLQHAPSVQYSRRRGDDGGGCGVKKAAHRANSGRNGRLRAVPTAQREVRSDFADNRQPRHRCGAGKPAIPTPSSIPTRSARFS
jgi:hypothetical protein